MTPPEILIVPTRTTLWGILASLGVAFAIALVAILLSDASLTPVMRVTAITLGAVWSLGFALIARLLLAARMGLLVDHTAARLGFCISRPSDVWWVPLARVAEVKAQAVAAAGQVAIEGWICQVRLKNHVQVVVVESGSREFIDHVVDGLRTKLKLAPSEASSHDDGDDDSGDDDSGPSGYESTSTTLAVARGGALQGVVFTFGLALILTGFLAFGQLGIEPIVGFIFGPLLLALGLVLVTTTVVKRFGREHLRHDGYYWYHHMSLGRLTWGDRKVRAKTPIWRIALLGARGGYLELKGDDGSIVLGASARATSRTSIDALSRLPDAFSSK